MKVKSGQVNKWIEIRGLELYCSTFQGNNDLSRQIVVDSKNNEGEMLDAHKCSSMLAPLNVSLSLSVSIFPRVLLSKINLAIHIEHNCGIMLIGYYTNYFKVLQFINI